LLCSKAAGEPSIRVCVLSVVGDALGFFGEDGPSLAEGEGGASGCVDRIAGSGVNSSYFNPT
jgi:hypothetical protein